MTSRDGVLLTVLMLAIAACAGTVRSGHLLRANQAVNKGNCAEALDSLSAAEILGDPSVEDQAQISFLRAQCFEQMGKTADAMGLYEFIVARAPDSPYAYRAKARLEALHAAATPAAP